MAEPKKIYTYRTDMKLNRAQLGVYFSAVQRMQQDLEDAVMRGKEDKGFPEAKNVIDRIRSM